MMKMITLLNDVEIFQGLTARELEMIAAICQEKSFQKGDILTSEGEIGDTLYIVKDGLISIEKQTSSSANIEVLVHLGRGQIIGEMSLVDGGPRSATARALQTPTRILVISHADFHDLCRRDQRIGYIVCRNIAADLSFKLRQRSIHI